MRYYKIPENVLEALLTDCLELTYLKEGGADNWDGYSEAVHDGIDFWKDEHSDIINTWDDDDPRREDLYIDDIAKEEINTYYKKYLLEEKKMIKNYRKKPVVIQAVEWTGNNIDEIDALGGTRDYHYYPGGELVIHTLEGDHHAPVGDFIIKGVRGELYPCEPNIFRETYEEVGE